MHHFKKHKQLLTSVNEKFQHFKEILAEKDKMLKEKERTATLLGQISEGKQRELDLHRLNKFEQQGIYSLIHHRASNLVTSGSKTRTRVWHQLEREHVIGRPAEAL